MFQVRVHGRGGQGVVTAAELLSVAGFGGGLHAQAFPSFGSERTGAPVVAYCRLDAGPIRTREPILAPDALVIQDSTLVHVAGVLDGLAASGFVLVNSTRTADELGLADLRDGLPVGHLVCVPASEIAREEVGRPLPNAALLGGLAGLTGVVRLDAVVAAVLERFPGAVGEGNARAAERAFDWVRRAAGSGPSARSSAASSGGHGGSREVLHAHAD